MVASEHPLASAAGIEVLRQGGNVVDAAIATAFAVCVLNSSSCGIGGGGFALIYLADEKKALALDYRETAPAAASRDMFVRDGKVDAQASRRGGLAVGIPGEVAGMAELAKKHGTMPLAKLLEPAIRLARDGYPAGKHLAATIAQVQEAIRQSPGLAANFLGAGGKPPAAGETIRQPQLARTLQRIADEGAQAFYGGEIAKAIVAATGAAGGILSEDDLKNYRPVWREPLELDFRGYEIVAMPPPSSAGVVLEVLGILRDDDLAKRGHNSTSYLHLLAEALKDAFADRAGFYGDPIAVNVPLPRLLSVENTSRLRQRIDPEDVRLWTQYGSSIEPAEAPPADGGTSHLSVIDRKGNAVACTTTINTAFGSMVVAGDTGIILNNEMDDFSAQPGAGNVYGLIGSEANSIAPGKRPLSSMSPTIATRDGKAVLALGGSGGPFILSGTVQVLLNSIVFDQSAGDAVAAPRIHHQWVPAVLVAEEALAPATREGLRQLGHRVETLRQTGAVQLVRRRGERFEGAGDPRKHGGAAGW
jgi:gamma-glutamyltranspeptidase/glutathione hydrolase